MIRALAFMALLSAGAAQAAPETSKRPVGRPGSTVSGALAVQVRPSGDIVPPRRSPEGQAAALRGDGPRASLRPLLRSPAAAKAGKARQALAAKGAICGDVAIQGEHVGRVQGRISGCGVEQAVKVRAISGIALSQRAVMDCKTAQALKSWIDTTAKPALRRKGGGLTGIRVAAHYACRPRNNQKGKRISEHGKGRAIDISGFQLRDGSVVSVLDGWSAHGSRAPLRSMHKGACGPFGTVLGPAADRFHRDHFHFDTARYRSGPYCR